MYIDIHTHQKKQGAHIQVYNYIFGQEDIVSPPSYYSIGIHPYFISSNYQNQLKGFKKKIETLQPIALGECGLDKFVPTPFEIQKEVFISQILLSEELKLPLIIHCVKSFDTLLQLKEEIKPKQYWLIHGFNKKPELATQLLNHDFYLSLNSILPALDEIPLNKLFLETDEKKVDIENIYEQVASSKNIPENKLKEKILSNFKTVFNVELA